MISVKLILLIRQQPIKDAINERLQEQKTTFLLQVLQDAEEDFPASDFNIDI